MEHQTLSSNSMRDVYYKKTLTKVQNTGQIHLLIFTNYTLPKTD